MRASKIKKTLDSFLGRKAESWGRHTWVWLGSVYGPVGRRERRAVRLESIISNVWLETHKGGETVYEHRFVPADPAGLLLTLRQARAWLAS